MIIKINMQSEIPIYLQLRNEIVKGIGRGEFEPGESLPTVRQMATDLGMDCDGGSYILLHIHVETGY